MTEKLGFFPYNIPVFFGKKRVETIRTRDFEVFEAFESFGDLGISKGVIEGLLKFWGYDMRDGFESEISSCITGMISSIELLMKRENMV